MGFCGLGLLLLFLGVVDDLEQFLVTLLVSFEILLELLLVALTDQILGEFELLLLFEKSVDSSHVGL